MHRKMMRWVAASCFALALAACGPSEVQDEASAPVSQVEQGIGDTPLCQSDMYYEGYIESKTELAASCGGCLVSRVTGRKAADYQRCCRRDRAGDYAPTCGSWQLIRSYCVTCELQ
jgi:hypothetical protein